MQARGQHEAVTAIIRMIQDLEIFGPDSRYAKPLKGMPIWELKTRARGGVKGGARLYFYWTADGVAVLTRAEVKADDTPNLALLKQTLQHKLERRAM